MEATPLWERSKENAAPLERGRSVVALERSIAAMESEEDRREQSRLSEHYERLVRTSEALDYEASGDDDPLIHWLSYIKYHQDAFPSDTHSQFLLFERCLRALSPIQKYANDPRFVRVCCMYADKTDRPLEVFQHLHQQRIGSDIAVFWMAWAFKAEQQQNYQFAEKILDKGIRKKAQPLKLLLQRHKQFQRRMTRHWLNATQAEEENEDTLEQSSARGVLGALSDERISRNDRAAVASLNVVPSRTTSNLSTFSDRNASHRSQLQTRSNTSTKGAFAIFVDHNEENSGFSGFNDSTPGEDAIQTRQRLEREEDRKKENTQAVETWNHRGAYTSLYAAAAPPSRAPGLSLAPFAVHVDDECATRQEREEQERLQHRDQHRSRRDERTFRERDTVGVAERLSKDPLHYMRNPEQFATDQKAEESISAAGKRQAKSTKSNKYAFNKYLLKSSIGKEQCFEEARAHARYFQLALPSSDVNLFFRQLGQKQNDSNMSTSVDETNDDVSFDDVQRPLFRPEEAASKPKALGIRMLTPQDSSFDVLTPRNISTASSTIDEANAVGAPIRRDEQTINTQLALKELSIMFSSPAMGLNDSSVRYNGLGTIMNDSGVSEVVDPPPNNAGETGDTAAFAAIAELVGEESNNSFSRSVDPGLNEEMENNGPRNPKPRSNDTPGFDGLVLRTMKEEQDRPRLSCQSESIRTIGQIAQHDPTRDNEERELDTDPGFTVFNDSENRSTNPVPSFTIFQDEALSRNSNEHPSRQFAPFQIRNDTQQQSPSEQRSMSRIAVDVFRESATSLEVAADSEGDTATFSLLGDAMDALADVSYGGSTIEESVVEGEDLDNGSNKRQRHESKGASEGFDFGDISRIVPTDDTTMLFVPCVERAVEYNDLHKRDVQEARERISQRSVGRLKPNKSLANILAKPNNLYNLASHVLPRSLKGKKLTTGAGINVGASSSTVKHELGRGVYGVVTLLETTEPALDGSNVIAVKAQSPTDCLAWEFEVMEKLLQRVGPSLRTSESTSFPFARPLTFMSLADGGLLSMTAGSRSGLNLLDLSNFYQVKLQERIPEELVLYYTSRILHHLELLHWHGKMLHCDAKPDNWVLVSSSIVANQELEASDLMLVDFGRAKDLTALHQGLEPLDVKFVGDAVVPDMMCVAMRQGLPWSFDIDTFAACASAHVLLFGSHLQIRLDQNKRWMPKERLHRRLHTVELWTDFFGTLLNLEEGSRAAIGSRPLSLRQLRQRIEAHIGEKHRHATLLRALKHQAALLPSTRL